MYYQLTETIQIPNTKLTAKKGTYVREISRDAEKGILVSPVNTTREFYVKENQINGKVTK